MIPAAVTVALLLAASCTESPPPAERVAERVSWADLVLRGESLPADYVPTIDECDKGRESASTWRSLLDGNLSNLRRALAADAPAGSASAVARHHWGEAKRRLTPTRLAHAAAAALCRDYYPEWAIKSADLAVSLGDFAAMCVREGWAEFGLEC